MKQFLILVALATFFIEINAEKFSCEGRASGYYADVDTGCQVYHMCDGLGRQFSYSCPNTTLFQQRMLICDHWYMVNCSKSEIDYKANLLIGQRDKPFVEDSSEHPYHRTPRPDLLQQPYAPRYQDEEYRESRAQNLAASSLNLVGVATEDDAEDELGNRKNFTTDRPQYFLPSHWSTQYGKYVTTPIPPKPQKSNNQFIGKTPEAPEKKFPNPNFKDFKDVLSRKQTPQNNFNNQKFSKSGKPQIINSRVDNIPDSINLESVSPSTLALPPFVPKTPVISAPPTVQKVDISNIPKPSIFYQPPKLGTVVQVESSTMDPESFYKLIPSKDLLPPPLRQLQTSTPQKVSTPVTEKTKVVVEVKPQQKPAAVAQVAPIAQVAQISQTAQVTQVDNSEKRWKELRQMFFIPEYEFPLEAGNRPSYESGLSSFQVNVAPPIPEAFRRMEQASGPRGINPECPKCDPAFLAPGTCKPCIQIR